MSPIGEPKKLAFDGSTVLAPSRKDRMGAVEESSLLMTSDFWWFPGHGPQYSTPPNPVGPHFCFPPRP